MKLPRNFDLWGAAYIRDRLEIRGRGPAKRLWVSITDHYEPMGGGVTLQRGKDRVRAWQERWPRIAQDAPRDAAGNMPCYTMFYPQEEYQREILDSLAELTRAGLTDVEVHIHHDHDTPAGFREKIQTFCKQLHEQHGLLRYRDSQLSFGFIHGNWALDNSFPDGRACGVTGELALLRELGCYADFTMPSAPSETQSRIVNRIYWTAGHPGEPRGFDVGISAEAGFKKQTGLLMISGPLGLRFRGRLIPRVEMGELAIYDPPSAYRVKRWLELAPRLGDDIFLKLYAHGAREDNAGSLLGTGSGRGTLAPMFEDIAAAAKQRGLELHWASAYQMFQAVEAAATRNTASVPQHEVAV